MPVPLAPKVVPANGGADIVAFGIPMNIRLRAEETGGAFAALVASFERGMGPPPHFHHDHEEYFFVLAGSFELTVGGETFVADEGAIAFVPRETVHSFRCLSEKGRILEWGTPGGQEKYFEAVDAMARTDALTPEKVVALSKEFETEFVG